MYQYDFYDKKIVTERAQQFRDQVRRHLAGEIEDDEFQQLRLRNGLYMQRHAYMLRVAVPYGLLNAPQLRTLGHIARKYDRGFGHITTRQNIQYNWLELAQVPDILDDLAKVEMHAIQTSGNNVRNVCSDPFAGVAADELEDPRPYCEVIRQWFNFHPEFNWLPRKFKFAVTGAQADRAAILWNDVGLRLVENESGDIGFQVFVGGGMGRAPHVGQEIRSFLPKKDLLNYLDAILRTYNLLGRRDNIHRARIKFLVKQFGIEEFSRLVEEEFQQARSKELEQYVLQEIERVSQYFSVHYDTQSTTDTSHQSWLKDSPQFAKWYRSNTRSHKMPGYRAVVVSLKPPMVAPGDITSEQLEGLADLADKYSFGMVRSTEDQNLILADVANQSLYVLWQSLEKLNLATANVGQVTDMICCPGLDYCSLANASSISVAADINQQYSDPSELEAIGPLQLKMSGCMNACGHHHAGDIGILGVEKKGSEWYQFTLGGAVDEHARTGKRIGAAVPKDQAGSTVKKITLVYLSQRLTAEETFAEFVRRVGVKPFQEEIYENHVGSVNHSKKLAVG